MHKAGRAARILAALPLLLPTAQRAQYSRDRGRWTDSPGGERRFEPASPEPPEAVPDPDSGYHGSFAEAREVALAEGIVEVAGLTLRLARGADGWTVTPLAARFRTWIRFGCGGRSLLLGAPG